MTEHLSDLRSEPGRLARLGSRVSAGVRAVESTRQPFADWWEARNRAALEQDGPLWLVLGDSTSQGIGASTPEEGWVPRLRDRLREVTGDPWRVLNLSITGATLADVVDRELVVHERLVADGHVRPPADLVTCFAGANDVQVLWGVQAAGRTARRLVDALPEGSLVGRVASGPLSRPKAQAINDAFRRARDAGHVHLFHPWAWPSRRGTMAQDRFHPGDRGYAYTAEAIWPTIEEQVVRSR